MKPHIEYIIKLTLRIFGHNAFKIESFAMCKWVERELKTTTIEIKV